jgi:hypothetical protein
MRSTFSLNKFMAAACAAIAVLSQVEGALAQVGVLNPNPTMPGDVPIGSGAYGNSSGGIGIGRGPIPPGQSGEKNPAEAMLKSLEGTNYGRYTGRAIYTPGEANAASSSPRRPRQSPAAAARGESVAVSPLGGRPENRWRYRLSQGRWWYKMDGGRWSYFDGNRWVPYRPAAGVSSARRSRG